MPGSNNHSAIGREGIQQEDLCRRCWTSGVPLLRPLISWLLISIWMNLPGCARNTHEVAIPCLYLKHVAERLVLPGHFMLSVSMMPDALLHLELIMFAMLKMIHWMKAMRYCKICLQLFLKTRAEE